MQIGNRILVISSHPDDELLGLGGTIKKLSESGLFGLSIVALSTLLISFFELTIDFSSIFDVFTLSPFIRNIYILYVCNLYAKNRYKIYIFMFCLALCSENKKLRNMVKKELDNYIHKICTVLIYICDICATKSRIILYFYIFSC